MSLLSRLSGADRRKAEHEAAYAKVVAAAQERAAQIIAEAEKEASARLNEAEGVIRPLEQAAERIAADIGELGKHAGELVTVVDSATNKAMEIIAKAEHAAQARLAEVDSIVRPMEQTAASVVNTLAEMDRHAGELVHALHAQGVRDGLDSIVPVSGKPRQAEAFEPCLFGYRAPVDVGNDKVVCGHCGERLDPKGHVAPYSSEVSGPDVAKTEAGLDQWLGSNLGSLNLVFSTGKTRMEVTAHRKLWLLRDAIDRRAK